jgi:hypothetical protein
VVQSLQVQAVEVQRQELAEQEWKIMLVEEQLQGRRQVQVAALEEAPRSQ